MKKRSVGTSAVCAILAFCAWGHSITGVVTRVSDGDTIWVTPREESRVKVRMNRIDAPEKDQPFGREATQFLSGLVKGREVVVAYEGKDRYGRLLGIVNLGTNDVNLAMVRAGMAWHYRHYDKTPAYIAAEAEAKAAKRGLWSDACAINPYDWRKGSRIEQGSTIRSHTVSGWFCVPATNDETTVYIVKSRGDREWYRGYKFAVTREGFVKIGEINANNDWQAGSGHEGRIFSGDIAEGGKLPVGSWCYLTVAIKEVPNEGKILARVFVNAQEINMPPTPARIIVSNGDNNDVLIGEGVQYTGLRFDDKPIVNTEKMKSWATDPRYVTPAK